MTKEEKKRIPQLIEDLRKMIESGLGTIHYTCNDVNGVMLSVRATEYDGGDMFPTTVHYDVYEIVELENEDIRYKSSYAREVESLLNGNYILGVNEKTNGNDTKNFFG